jgi:hypothetical protein
LILRRVVWVAKLRGGRQGVDEDQGERQAEPLLHAGRRCGDDFVQFVERPGLSQTRAALPPNERHMFRVDRDDVPGRPERGDPIVRHALDPYAHLALSFRGEQQDAALPMDRAPCELGFGHHRGGEVEHDESLVGSPLSCDEREAGPGQHLVDRLAGPEKGVAGGVGSCPEELLHSAKCLRSSRDDSEATRWSSRSGSSVSFRGFPSIQRRPLPTLGKIT